MTKTEKKFFDFLKNHILTVIFFTVTILAIAIHFCGIGLESGDYQSFLKPWWQVIKSSGIGGLSKQVGNYNIPYQIITFIMTLFPWDSLIAYKSLSIVFDFVLAGAVMKLIVEITKSKVAGLVGYSLTIFSMTVILNSSFWAQCDSIYVAFIILAIYFIFKDKTALSFIMLGISFAFKLQMVFILPVFLFYYILDRKVSIIHFLIIPAVDFILCFPAVLLGRNIIDIFTIYAAQTDYGKLIQMNCPNLYALICNGSDANYYYMFKLFSILFTIAVIGFMLGMFIFKKVDLKDRRKFLMTAIWTVFTCVMFLSSMHERYSYLLDILLIAYAVSYRKNIIPAILCNLISLRGYASYLFKYDVVANQHAAIVYIGIYFYLSYVLVKEVLLNNNSKTELKVKI